MDTEKFSESLNNNLPIGILDSGVGGLTVLSELKKILPNEKYLYFGDTKNLPYGEKTPEELYCLVENILKFFEKKNVKAVIFACNTTAAAVYELIKDKFDFPIYPIIQGACKKISCNKSEKIGVFATQATVSSGMYTKTLKKIFPDINVLEIACPKWVGFVENNLTSSKEAQSDIIEKLKLMKTFGADRIILGCTHYPYLLNTLKQYEEEEKFINPAGLFAQFIKEDLQQRGLTTSATEESNAEFFVSSTPAAFQSTGNIFFPIAELPTVV